MPDPIPFYTVGQLRAALEGVPNDRLLMTQVVASESGGAWNMHAAFTSCVQGGNIAVVTVSHPQLRTLPEIP